MFYSKIKKQLKTYNRRSILLIVGKFSLFSVVGLKLFNIQILNSKKYKTLSNQNQISLELLYPNRGNILDRNNNVIATNKNTYDLYLIPEQTESVEQTLKKLSEFIFIDFKTKRKIINSSKKIKKFNKITILEKLDWQDLERIESNKLDLPGIHLQLIPQRIYPYHRYLSHILGFTNQPSEEDLNLPFIYNMPLLEIGKSGIEKLSNNKIIGHPGKREIEVNAIGRVIREISKEKSIKGENVIISIDLKVQKFVHEQLNQHKAGSVVVLDINTGEIISMVSIPDYNPNLIIKKPNKIYWGKIIGDPLSPLLNRSLQGLYAPGSTFKMIVALAGLSKGVISTEDNEFCKGKIELGERLYHCWKTKGHGKISLNRAIKESCDVYFYQLSKKIGIDYIAKIAKEFGLGQISNIGLEIEKQGIIPTKKWKKRTLKQNWYVGDTLNAAVGQGYVLSNPLQLAVMTARIASDGKKIEPSIFKQNKAKEFKKINLNKKYINIIKKAMFSVVNESMGTAYKSRSEFLKFSGKTGTSQVKKITIEEREREDFKTIEREWKNTDHALFVGYMPSKAPKYALSIIIEHGGSGASKAAPIAKNIFNYLNQIYNI